MIPAIYSDLSTFHGNSCGGGHHSVQMVSDIPVNIGKSPNLASEANPSLSPP